MKLPLALTELGLIDEYEFVVQPRLGSGHPRLVTTPQTVQSFTARSAPARCRI